jgi:hypothetical protein
MQQSCSIGHSISKRRPIDLTPEQSASVATHPTIKHLEKRLGTLPRNSKDYKERKRAIRKEKQRLRRELIQKIRDEWTDQQATEDIERQIQGLGFSSHVAVDTTCRPQGPAQKYLLSKLSAPMATTLKGQYRRRDDAIDAVSAYCLVQEGCTVRRQSASKKAAAPAADSLLEDAMLSVFVTDNKQRPRRCFLCIGQAMVLSPDDKHRLRDLTREFYTSSDLTKHFGRKHLSKIKKNTGIKCRVCDIPLEHKMHLQNHALRIHGTVSPKGRKK